MRTSISLEDAGQSSAAPHIDHSPATLLRDGRPIPVTSATFHMAVTMIDAQLGVSLFGFNHSGALLEDLRQLRNSRVNINNAIASELDSMIAGALIVSGEPQNLSQIERQINSTSNSIGGPARQPGASRTDGSALTRRHTAALRLCIPDCPGALYLVMYELSQRGWSLSHMYIDPEPAWIPVAPTTGEFPDESAWNGDSPNAKFLWIWIATPQSAPPICEQTAEELAAALRHRSQAGDDDGMTSPEHEAVKLPADPWTVELMDIREKIPIGCPIRPSRN